MTILEGVNVGYRVGKITLVSDINLRVEPGELIAVVGPNGAGKSTLLRLLAGDLRPSTGHVILRGVPIDKLPHDELALHRSILLQHTNSEIPFTVAAVVTMGRHPHRLDPDNSAVADQLAVDDALDRTGISHLRNRIYATLSSGEQSRVSLARILAQDAPVVLLDEPTTSLDIAHEERAMAEFRRMADTGSTVVAVLHDLNAAARYATRIIMVANGTILTEGPARAVFTDSTLTQVYGQSMRVVDHPFGDFPLVLVDNPAAPGSH
jgi:iron complex transport system ATP-binding protein